MTEPSSEGARAPDPNPKGETWAPIIERAIMDPNLSGGALKLMAMMVVIDRPRRSGGVWESSRQLARKLGLSTKTRSTVVRYLEELEESGYVERQTDPNGDGSGRFIKFLFTPAMGRTTNEAPPVSNPVHLTGVHLFDGDGAPQGAGAPVSSSARGRRRPTAPAPQPGGASASGPGHPSKRERSKRNGDGGGPGSGGASPPRPAAEAEIRRQARDIRGYTAAQVLMMPDDEARAFILTPEEHAAAESNLRDAVTPGIAALAYKALENHVAAEIRLGIRPVEPGGKTTPPAPGANQGGGGSRQGAHP